jgi:hypothetical protein
MPPASQPAHMTNAETGERIDLDKMLLGLHLMRTDFNGAPSHKVHVAPIHCRHGHLWTEHGYRIPGTTTRICLKCKDDSRLRARASAKASKERKRLRPRSNHNP